MAKNKKSDPDFQVAATLFALGQLTSEEAKVIAFDFRTARDFGSTIDTSSPEKIEENTQPASGDSFDELRGPDL